MKRFFSKRRFIWIAIILLIPLLLFLLRIPILQGVGHALIVENQPEQVEVVFILGGASFDRGNAAAGMLQQGLASQVVCLGENVPTIFKAMDLPPVTESEITRSNVIRNGVDSSRVKLLTKGTSTREEVQAIIAHCRQNNITRSIVIGDKFHTRRIRSVIDELSPENGQEFLIIGAPSSVYSEEEWWRSEEGMIMVNNEYMKLVYYWFKY